MSPMGSLSTYEAFKWSRNKISRYLNRHLRLTRNVLLLFFCEKNYILNYDIYQLLQIVNQHLFGLKFLFCRFLVLCNIASKINVTPKGVYLLISKLHSIFAAANLLVHDNISQICYCGQISLQSAAVNWSISENLTTLSVTFILLAMVHVVFQVTTVFNLFNSISKFLQSSGFEIELATPVESNGPCSTEI